jgi:hypothetical protein
MIFRDDGRLAASLVEAARHGLPANFTPEMARNLLSELRTDQPQVEERSAALTLLGQLVRIQEAAAEKMFALIDVEKVAMLRAHGILLLSQRGPWLSKADRERAKKLLNGLLRKAPPYAELRGPWRIAMCSASEFHKGDCDCLAGHGFRIVNSPSAKYQVLEAPFHNPSGDSIQIWARPAEVSDEVEEMGDASFMGLIINRHAQLGIYDLLSSETNVEQHGYKLMFNSECCGLTTRWVVQRRFPDADLYSSWDSTSYRYHGKKVIADEGIDCFVALLQGMAHGDTHEQLQARIHGAQWDHGRSNFPGFTQFVGPAHPLVIERFQDLNDDGRADVDDGFLDFDLKPMREQFAGALTPKDPNCAPSQISGEAASGLEWAAGSLDRATKYSEIWWQLPGTSESRYLFTAGGFYDQNHPPPEVPEGGRMPAVCRYHGSGDKLTGEILFHSWLSHCPRELKRLLCAAEAMRRAFELKLLPAPQLATPFAQRGAILLTMMGLLAFPADPNHLDAIWALALQALQFPELARNVVASCISEKDQEKRDDYYGSFEDLIQLKTAIRKADPLALEKLESDDPQIGRARLLDL